MTDVDSDSSRLVKFADDLTLSVLVKRIQDQAPQEVQNIISWVQDNLMTIINLTKTKEMVVKSKMRDPFPLSFLISNRKNFLQSRQVKRNPQNYINEFIIWKVKPLVVPVTGVKFKLAFLHA